MLRQLGLVDPLHRSRDLHFIFVPRLCPRLVSAVPAMHLDLILKAQRGDA